uniref:Uncharacterized protein n=1 Tax=Anguilla anguilla TaxID=7936 RepID=A0A0E9VRG8_ANGAN
MMPLPHLYPPVAEEGAGHEVRVHQPEELPEGARVLQCHLSPSHLGEDVPRR